MKNAFKRNLGSASRSNWQQMKRTRAGVSFETAKRVLWMSQLYRRYRRMFKNKVPPKPVMSPLVNKRWQIDLNDMHSDEVLYEEKPQRYISSIIDMKENGNKVSCIGTTRSAGLKTRSLTCR